MRDIEAGASMISNPRLFPGKERVTNARNTCVLQLFLSTEVHIFMATWPMPITTAHYLESLSASLMGRRTAGGRSF